MAGPLNHLRVLDLSRVLAGPWAGQTLADLGAEVIKVERPVVGDDTRAWGPPFLCDAGGRPTTDAAYFLSANRGKKSVSIDFTRPAGQELVRRLAEQSDILLENFKVGGLARYGLDYDSLKKINPRLIYCSITGFGQTGPYRHRAGYDFLIQGMGGLMSVTGEADGEPGGGPMKVGVAIVDIFTGMYASTAVLAAIAHREQSGEGQQIDIALLDVQVATLANQAMNYLVSGAEPQRMGNAHPNIVPYQVLATADGHIIMTVGNDRQFGSFCAVAGLPALAGDPRFNSNAGRVENRKVLIPILEQALLQRRSVDWIALLEGAGVPCGPINNLAEVFADPQVIARQMRIEMDHRSGGKVALVGSPLKFSKSPVEYTQAPPLLGEHNAEIFGERLGLSAQQRQELAEQGIIDA
jgi:crotonobetainyl-CoA:carnitine CoA-transferase CaiB-like acyl-CoA transferase